MAPIAPARVIEMTAGIVGPLAGRLLADLGADVIKVELPANGARSPRNIGQGEGDPAEAAPWDNDPTFNCLNRGKRSCVLDLQHPEGRAAFRELTRQSDVVLTNFSARVLPNLGFGFEALSAINNQIILAQVTGYGLTGPKRDWVAFGPTIESVTGMAALNELPSIGPSVTTLPLLDQASAVRAASLVVAALTRRPGAGPQLLDLSMQETAMLLMSAESARAVGGDAVDHQQANSHPTHVPYGVFETRDGEWLALSVESDASWRRLSDALLLVWSNQLGPGFPAPRAAWDDAHRRLDDRNEVQAWVATIVSQLPGIACERQLLESHVDASLVARPRHLLEDRTLRESRLLVRRGNAATGPRTYPTSAVLWDGERSVSEAAAPRYGEHSAFVLREICGLSSEQFERLSAEGVTHSMEVG